VILLISVIIVGTVIMWRKGQFKCYADKQHTYANTELVHPDKGPHSEIQAANEKGHVENTYESVSKTVYEDVTVYTELKALNN
jgi:hypothetical protein